MIHTRRLLTASLALAAAGVMAGPAAAQDVVFIETFDAAGGTDFDGSPPTVAEIDDPNNPGTLIPATPNSVVGGEYVMDLGQGDGFAFDAQFDVPGLVFAPGTNVVVSTDFQLQASGASSLLDITFVGVNLFGQGPDPLADDFWTFGVDEAGGFVAPAFNITEIGAADIEDFASGDFPFPFDFGLTDPDVDGVVDDTVFTLTVDATINTSGFDFTTTVSDDDGNSFSFVETDPVNDFVYGSFFGLSGDRFSGGAAGPGELTLEFDNFSVEITNGVAGDLNGNGVQDPTDVDTIAAALGAQVAPFFEGEGIDLDGDGVTGEFFDFDLVEFDEVTGDPIVSTLFEIDRADALLDTDADFAITLADRTALVEDVFGTNLSDFNLDGDADLLDFDILANNFGTSGGFGAGDANGDGVVDLLDFDTLAGLFGTSGPPAAVPEPASFALLLCAGTATLRRRRG
ncbi:MAG: hypothetical protein AAF288_04675 [Planctomycetota bacterium]